MAEGAERGGEPLQLLESLLLELIWLGSLHDVTAGRRWSWDSAKTMVCVEVSSPLLIDQLAVLALLPQVEVVARRDTFCASELEVNFALRAGRQSLAKGWMQLLPLPDVAPTPDDEAGSHFPPPSPAESLAAPSKADLGCVQFVCRALAEWEQQEGHTPANYEPATPVGMPLPGAICFDLLRPLLVIIFLFGFVLLHASSISHLGASHRPTCH